MYNVCSFDLMFNSRSSSSNSRRSTKKKVTVIKHYCGIITLFLRRPGKHYLIGLVRLNDYNVLKCEVSRYTSSVDVTFGNGTLPVNSGMKSTVFVPNPPPHGSHTCGPADHWLGCKLDPLCLYYVPQVSSYFWGLSSKGTHPQYPTTWGLFVPHVVRPILVDLGFTTT